MVEVSGRRKSLRDVFIMTWMDGLTNAAQSTSRFGGFLESAKATIVAIPTARHRPLPSRASSRVVADASERLDLVRHPLPGFRGPVRR